MEFKNRRRRAFTQIDNEVLQNNSKLSWKANGILQRINKTNTNNTNINQSKLLELCNELVFLYVEKKYMVFSA